MALYLGARALLLGVAVDLATGFRIGPKSQGKASLVEANETVGLRLIAGVPLHTYDHLAKKGRIAAKPKTLSGATDYIVFFKEGTSETLLDSLCGGNCKLQGHPGAGGLPFAELSATEAQLEEHLLELSEHVDFVEADVAVREMPDMPSAPTVARASYYDKPWGLDRIGAKQRGGEGVNVYVVDSGIHASHQDFSGKAEAVVDFTKDDSARLCADEGAPVPCPVCEGYTCEEWISYDSSYTCAYLKSEFGCDCSGCQSCPGARPSVCGSDGNGHGTHCAAIVGGRTYGVAPGVAIHAVKVLDDTGAGYNSWILGGMDWVASNRKLPAVASLSLGVVGAVRSLGRGVDRMVKAGVTVVVAAGNEQDDACGYSPGFATAAITVGATNEWDSIPKFSNYGPCVDLFAPGADTYSAGHKYNTHRVKMSGTSQACPHVAGAAALVLQKDPSLSPAQVLSKILAGAERGTLWGHHDGDPELFLNLRNLGV